MQLQYFNAPMHYIQGTPAYKYGEWEGQMSCKFGPTRKILRPINNENPILTGTKGIANIMPRKKHFERRETREYDFKPCLKLVSNDKNSNVNRKEGVKIIRPDFTSNKERLEKKHKFEYIDRRDMEIRSMLNRGVEDNVRQEFKNILKVGFNKKDFVDDYYKKIKRLEGSVGPRGFEFNFKDNTNDSNSNEVFSKHSRIPKFPVID